MASTSAGAPALKYGYVNTLTPSPGEAKGLITFSYQILDYNYHYNIIDKWILYNIYILNININLNIKVINFKNRRKNKRIWISKFEYSDKVFLSFSYISFNIN